MNPKLQKIKNENYRIYYLKFSVSKYFLKLDKYTRFKSLIIYNEIEISNVDWQYVCLSLVNHLQRLHNISLKRLLQTKPDYLRDSLFVENPTSGYDETNFGLYIKRFNNVERVLLVIRSILEIYFINSKDAYVVVEIPPKYLDEEKEPWIEQEKYKLKRFIYSKFKDCDKTYELITSAIESLNEVLDDPTFTGYNNLYLLNSLKDYRVYSSKALNIDWKRSGSFTQTQYEKAVEYLEVARFYNGDIYKTKPIEISNLYIDDDNRIISIDMKTHFYDETMNMEANKHE